MVVFERWLEQSAVVQWWFGIALVVIAAFILKVVGWRDV
jgi:hypothetical protein